jgi:2'-5' RNA ligase
MPRLFEGSFLEGPEAERISAITKARASQISSGFLPGQQREFKIRALPKEKLHMTWLFLGEVHSSAVEELTRQFTSTLTQLKQKLSRSAFEISYEHLSLWPNEEKTRVVVLRPSMPPPVVSLIDSEIRAALSTFQENEEVYPQFNPHLTLFRVSPAADLRAIDLLATQAIAQEESKSKISAAIYPVKQTITIDGIRLIKSENGYTIIA